MNIRPGSELWNRLDALHNTSPEKLGEVVRFARDLEDLKKTNPDGYETVCRLVEGLAKEATA